MPSAFFRSPLLTSEEENIQNEYLIHWGWRIIQPPNTAYLYFYCNEADVPDKTKNDPLWSPMCTVCCSNSTSSRLFTVVCLVWVLS